MAQAHGLHGRATEDTYEKAGFGQHFTPGTRPVVVVVDLCHGFTEDRYDTGADLSDVVASTRTLLDVARAAGTRVVFTTIAYDPAEISSGSVTWLAKATGMRSLVAGTRQAQLDSRLERRTDELLLTKRGPSAFWGTDLTAVLAAWRADSLVVCGATTSGCVRATVVDGVQAGYPVFVPVDCVGDRASGPHDAALFDMEAKYADVIGLAEAVAILQKGEAR